MTKLKLIQKIQSIIEEIGFISIAETNQSTPIYKQFDKDVYILIEGLDKEKCLTTKYVHETECNNYEVLYSELSVKLLIEILDILNTHLENGFDE